MSRIDEYRQHAEEAGAAARKALSEPERRWYEKIAQGWRDLEAAARIAERRGL